MFLFQVVFLVILSSTSQRICLYFWSLTEREKIYERKVNETIKL